jgi:hypothetical protein
MPSKSNFWLTLQRLADDLRQEGETDDQRTGRLIAALEAMSSQALSAQLDELAAVTDSLNHLLARCKVR